VQARPCFGPCDPSIVEWIAWAGPLLTAVALAAVAWVIARRRRGRNDGSMIAPVALLIAAIALVVVVAPRFPRPTFVPVAMVVGLDGSGDTDLMYLQGTYAVTWTAPCDFRAGLHRAEDRTLILQLVSQASPPGAISNTDPLPGGGYYIEGSAACAWKVTLTPRSDVN
jgi:hypothetical protein